MANEVPLPVCIPYVWDVKEASDVNDEAEVLERVVTELDELV